MAFETRSLGETDVRYTTVADEESPYRGWKEREHTVEPGGQLNFQELMQQAQQLLAAQQELAEAEVTGTSGGGLVTATVSGQGEVTGISIDPKAIDPDDPAETAETLADLVLAAIRDAGRSAEELQQSRMGPLAAGLGGGVPGIPGMPPGLGDMLGGGGGVPGLPGFPGLQGPGGAAKEKADRDDSGPDDSGDNGRPGTSGA
jgi:nucleoid-associated protein EbfC